MNLYCKQLLCHLVSWFVGLYTPTWDSQILQQPGSCFTVGFTGWLGLWFTGFNSLMTDQGAINVHLKPCFSVCSRCRILVIHLPNEEKCIKNLKAGGMPICNLLGGLKFHFHSFSLKMDTAIFVCKLEWKELQYEVVTVTVCYVRRTTKCQRRMDIHHTFCHNRSS